MVQENIKLIKSLQARISYINAYQHFKFKL